MTQAAEIMELALREQFTDDEWYERKRHIFTLKNFAGASVAAAKALSEIHAKKLYRPHKTLKEFCERECGFTKQRLFQIISFAEVRKALPDKSQQLLTHENQARALAQIPEEHRETVLNDALTIGEPTAALITQLGKKYETDGEVVMDKNGIPIPKAALACWDRLPEVDAVLTPLRSAQRLINKLSGDDAFWRDVGVSTIRAEIKSLIHRIDGGAMAHVCPYCKGVKIDSCKQCRHTGLMSHFAWKNFVPEEMRK